MNSGLTAAEAMAGMGRVSIRGSPNHRAGGDVGATKHPVRITLLFAIWQLNCCHMAATKSSRRSPEKDFSLFFWTPATTESELRSAFRSKWDWVVAPHRSSAARYTTILSNLRCAYAAPEKATLDDIRQVLDQGLRRDTFNRLKSVINTSGEDLCHIVRIPPRTLARREVFEPDESERILRVASVFQKAIEVMGSLESARRWFAGPKKALGGKTPMEFCDTEPGAQEVFNLLGRIEHGVFT